MVGHSTHPLQSRGWEDLDKFVINQTILIQKMQRKPEASSPLCPVSNSTLTKTSAAQHQRPPVLPPLQHHTRNIKSAGQISIKTLI